MPGHRPHVLLLGNAAAAEMQPLVEWLSRSPVVARLHRASALAESRRLAAADPAIGLVVVLLGWSDEFAPAEIHELLSLFPLARLICCGGAWCDSDGRTRDIWPGGSRVRVELAPARIARVLALLSGAATATNGLEHASPLPLTASRGEAFEYDFSEQLPRLSPHVRVGIDSPDRALREMLKVTIRHAGASLVEPTREFDVLVFDADPWSTARRERLEQLRTNRSNMAIVGCVGFVRNDLIEELQRCGVVRTWFKLAPLNALCTEVAAAAGARVG